MVERVHTGTDSVRPSTVLARVQSKGAAIDGRYIYSRTDNLLGPLSRRGNPSPVSLPTRLGVVVGATNEGGASSRCKRSSKPPEDPLRRSLTHPIVGLFCRIYCRADGSEVVSPKPLPLADPQPGPRPPMTIK